MTVYVKSIAGVEFSVHTSGPGQIALQADAQPDGSEIVLIGNLTPENARKLASELNAAANLIEGQGK